MIKGGYILQPRSFDGSNASRLPPCTREVWLYVLRNVNYADTDKFKRGHGFFVIAEIREALCWHVGYRKMTYSKTQVAKALRRLCEENMMDTTKTTRGLIVTIRNYDIYQDPKNYEGHTEETTKDLRRSSGGDTIQKKVKKDKKDKKEPSLSKVTPLDDELAEYLAMRIKEHSPQAKCDLGKWADVIRLMRERDKRSENGIKAVIDFATNDSFWKCNIFCL